jgi:septal ring factor EnvC (AmiA/AmiB activator)
MANDNGPLFMNLHLPLALFALAIAIFFAAQISTVNRSGKTMRWQLANFDKQNSNLKDAQKQFAELLQAREKLVKQSGQVQEQYTALFNDVLDLAKDDADAKTVVEKWGIQRQPNPPAGGAAPASTSEATPASTTK